MKKHILLSLVACGTIAAHEPLPMRNKMELKTKACLSQNDKDQVLDLLQMKLNYTKNKLSDIPWNIKFKIEHPYFTTALSILGVVAAAKYLNEAWQYFPQNSVSSRSNAKGRPVISIPSNLLPKLLHLASMAAIPAALFLNGSEQYAINKAKKVKDNVEALEAFIEEIKAQAVAQNALENSAQEQTESATSESTDNTTDDSTATTPAVAE